MTKEKTPFSPWQILAAIMGALFLMSGADGQERVQVTFLLLAAACLVVERFLPILRQHLDAWLQGHPQLRTALHSGSSFWG